MRRFRVTLSGSYDVLAEDEAEAITTAQEYADLGISFDATIEPVVEERE